jgi:hypothetical protein
MIDLGVPTQIPKHRQSKRRKARPHNAFRGTWQDAQARDTLAEPTRQCRTRSGEMKNMHPTRRAARRAARKIPGAHAYRCGSCSFYHVGHYLPHQLNLPPLQTSQEGV